MRDYLLGASALALAFTGQAMAQSGALSKAVGGYSFEDAVKEAPGTKDFNSKDGKLTFAMALTEPDAGTNSLGLRTFARNAASWVDRSGTSRSSISPTLVFPCQRSPGSLTCLLPWSGPS